MSIVREFYPQCDVCGETNPDKLSETVKEVKQNAREDGWIIKRNGEIICDICQRRQSNE